MRSGFQATLVVTLLVAACSGASNDFSSMPSELPTIGQGSHPSTTPTSGSSTETSPAVPSSAVVRPGCDGEGAAWSSGPLARPTVLAEEPFLIRATIYPTPSYDANLWSQWGQGIVLSDGRFLSAIGDHEGRDGNSYFYIYDPGDESLRLISDVLSLTDHQSGDWGFGKVHAPMVMGPCDDVYVTSYWGTRSGLEFGESYDGDVLIRIDPRHETIASLGTFASELGVPSLAASPDRTLLFAEAADPFDDGGAFIAWDFTGNAEVFRDDDPAHTGFRAMAVDSEGGVYYSIGDGRLRHFTPSTGTATDVPGRMPGGFLRAATAPDEHGVIVAVTQNDPHFFTLDADGEIQSLSSAPGYTTTLARHGDLVYFVPGAHGDAWESGAPLTVLDASTGEQSVLIKLNDLSERTLGLRLGGTYNLAIDAAAERLFIGFNAGPADGDSTFGTVVLVVVDL